MEAISQIMRHLRNKFITKAIMKTTTITHPEKQNLKGHRQA